VSRSRQCGFSAKSSQMCPPAPGASASFNPSNPLNNFKSPSSNLMESVRWIRSRRSPAFSRRPKIPRLRAVGRRSGNGPVHIGPDSGAETESRRFGKTQRRKKSESAPGKRTTASWKGWRVFGSRPNGNFAKLKISQTKSATTSNLLALLANGTNLSVDCLFCAATLLGLSGFHARHIECIR
jgi:hypothetical protein